MKLNWGAWIYGLLSGFIGGGASAVTASVVLPGLDSKDFNFGGGLNKLLFAMGAFFLVHGILVAMAYLAKSPLPQAREEWSSEQREAMRQAGKI